MKRVNQWIIGKNIGQGGSGHVKECYLNNDSNIYAIKQLKEEKKGRKERFEIEIKTNLHLQGKENFYKTIPMIDYDKNEYSWYVSEIGIPSITYIKNKNIGPLEILHLYKEFLEGIRNLHEAKIFHRDIKADNILFYQNSFRIIDFGITSNNNLDSTHDLTRKYDKNQLGAKYTMAPEMRRSPVEADPLKADIYSLAKTLWSLITLDEKCFDGQYNKKNHSLDEYFKIKIINIHLLNNILYKCTSDKISDRMSINEIIKDIEYILYINLFEKNDNLHKQILQCRESSNTIIKQYFNEIDHFELMKLNNSHCNMIVELVNNGTFLYSQTNINNFKNKDIDYLLFDENKITIINNEEKNNLIYSEVDIDKLTDIYIINDNNIPFSVFIKRKDIYILFMCTNIKSHGSDFIFTDNSNYYVPENYLNDVSLLIRFLKDDVEVSWSLLLTNPLYYNKFFK